jgi:uncharacterized membrane protein
MKWIHIVAGLLSLVAGFAALYAPKGGPLHRRAGLAFVVAMLVMTGSAELIATFLRPNRGNQVAAALTFYFVCTAWLAVAKPVADVRRYLAGLALLGALVSARAFELGILATGMPNGAIDRIPAAPLFLFGVIGAIAVAMDARLLWTGRLEGRQRLTRHLWRMTYALWVATSSAFLGQAKFVPEPWRDLRLLAIPVVLVMLTGAWWVARMRWAKRPLGAPRTPLPRREGGDAACAANAASP